MPFKPHPTRGSAALGTEAPRQAQRVPAGRGFSEFMLHGSVH